MEFSAVVTALLSSAIFMLFPVEVFSGICHRLNPLLFERCINIGGYNYTAKFPNDISFHEQTFAYHLERDTRQFKQCSKHSDAILCALYVPKCVEDCFNPVLPCKEVCEQFVRDCEEVDYDKIEWIKGLCRLLPSTRNDRNCLRPANYKPQNNATTPILQNCVKLQMSSCSHLGYTHTTQSRDLQLILENVLKGKYLGNHTTCSFTLKKIFCAEFAPPCFPEHKEEIVLHTVCKSDCENVQRECPELYKEHFGNYSFCEQMATEKSNLDGFCKLTKWPTAVRWPTRPNLTETPSLHPSIPTASFSFKPSSYASSPSTTVSLSSVAPSPVPLNAKASTPVVIIAVSVVVVVITLIGIVFLLVSRKPRQCYQSWNAIAYRKQLNDWETTVSLKASTFAQFH